MVIPAATIFSRRVTGMRVPRMHGTPPNDLVVDHDPIEPHAGKCSAGPTFALLPDGEPKPFGAGFLLSTFPNVPASKDRRVIATAYEPAAPIDKDLYELPPKEAKDVAQVPSSLGAVIDRLENDHDYLLEGGVFTPD